MKQAHNLDGNKFTEETKPRKNMELNCGKIILMPCVFVADASAAPKNQHGCDRALSQHTHLNHKHYYK